MLNVTKTRSKSDFRSKECAASFGLEVIIKGSQGRLERRAGTWTQFTYTSQNDMSRDGTTYSRLGPLHQLAREKMSHRHGHRQSDGHNFSTEVPVRLGMSS